MLTWRKTAAAFSGVLAALLFAAVSAPVLVRADAEPDTILRGDANCDAAIDPTDAALLLQFHARLIDPLPCSNSLDTNRDGVLDAFDALIILQDAAGLIDQLGQVELDLCQRSTGTGKETRVEKTADLDGDGTPELLSIEFDPVAGTSSLTLAAVNDDTGFYDVLAKETVMTLFVASGGPGASFAAADLTGDGTDEAVLCVTAFGANDPFTSFAIFGYDGVSADLLYTSGPMAWAYVSYTEPDLMVTSSVDWFAHACIATLHKTYGWDGEDFVLVDEEMTKWFSDAACWNSWPPED